VRAASAESSLQRLLGERFLGERLHVCCGSQEGQSGGDPPNPPCGRRGHSSLLHVCCGSQGGLSGGRPPNPPRTCPLTPPATGDVAHARMRAPAHALGRSYTKALIHSTQA
jgi:hypothetical protein